MERGRVPFLGGADKDRPIRADPCRQLRRGDESRSGYSGLSRLTDKEDCKVEIPGPRRQLGLFLFSGLPCSAVTRKLGGRVPYPSMWTRGLLLVVGPVTRVSQTYMAFETRFLQLQSPFQLVLAYTSRRLFPIWCQPSPD